MYQQLNIPEELYNDEVLCFIADRHHATPQEVLQRFFEQREHASNIGTGTFQLEENEMAILRDMIIDSYS